MLVFMLVAIAASLQEPPTGAATNDTVQDVVIFGRRQRQSPVDLFRTLCFDANRLDGRAFRPANTPGWMARRGSTGSQDEAVSEVYVRREGSVELFLHIEEGVPDALPDVSRNRCSITIAGDHDASAVERELSALMGGRGTTDGVGDGPRADPRLGAWRRQAWFSIPDRSSRNWGTYMSERPQQPAGVRVVQPSYYRDKKYVVTELRSGEIDDSSVSQMVLQVFYRTPG